MVRAAARGIVDFSEADIDDPVWYRKLRFLLVEMNKEDRRQLKRFDHAASMTAAIVNAIQKRSPVDSMSDGLDTVIEMSNSLWPWLKADKYRETMAEQLAASWANEFGDMDDPETKKRIEETANAIKTRARLGRKDEPEHGK